MPRLAHISDLHFGRIAPNAVRLLLEDLEAQAPDYLLASGDITQAARRSEFEEAARFFEAAPGKAFVVPGNHDIPGWAVWRRLIHPYRRYRDFISEDINPVHVAGDIAIAGFNTARRVVYHWNWAHGRISRSQFSTLQEIGARAPDRPRIAMFHHPLLPPPPGASQRRVSRAEDFAKALSEAGFHIALTGHLHRTRITPVTDVYHGVAPGLYAVEAGTATSSRQRNQPNEYNVIDVSNVGATVRVRSFEGSAFVTRDEVKLGFGSV
jgi:3',5'-cyclic AMP phosphodiesterase CpdA